MKIVTVHRGARDGYQVARSLEEAGLLETLVTDLYWPAERGWAQALDSFLPERVTDALRSRYAESLPSERITSCWTSGVSSLAVSKAPWLPFEWERESARWCDRILGARAGKLATQRGAALLSYSYYGYSAFSSYGGHQPRILFQLHPHPASVQAILLRERLLNPDCASSLDKEWELALPKQDFNHLVDEVGMADHWLSASSFTKQTLVEAGFPAARVRVVPYGIDTTKFAPRKSAQGKGKRLQLLFVGRLGQRKGIKYLLQALDLLPKNSVDLTICGHPVDDMDIFRRHSETVHVRPSVNAAELLRAYQDADIFVFPSLAEGFAQVLLEAMASGLPIISTARTAAPDLIQHGQEGLIVEPGSATALAESLETFLRHPEKISAMGAAARARAEYFTWQRFRQEIAGFVRSVLGGSHEGVGP